MMALAAGVTLGAIIPQAEAGRSLNGLSRLANGLSSGGTLFDFGAVSVEDVQFPAVGSE